jgi:tryptophanyl-tRNA synthetase
MKVLDKQLEPIRQRRKEFEQDIPEVYNILKRGSDAAREVAAQTLHDVREAMRINYFDDPELIRQQAEKYRV